MCCLGYGNASYDKWHQFTSFLYRFCVICWCSWIVSIDLYSSRIIVLKARESSTGFIQPEKLLPFSTIYWYVFGYRFLWYTDKPTKISNKNSFKHCLILEKSFEHCLNWERFIITLQQLFHKIPKHFKNSKTIDISKSS